MSDHCYCLNNTSVPSKLKQYVSFDHSYSKSKSAAQSDSVEGDISDIETTLFDLSEYECNHRTLEVNGTKFKLLEVPGDGNCFFNCLGLVLNGDASLGSYYRRMICEYILTNWNAWSDLVALFHDSRVNSAPAYSHQMLNKNAWATACEINAASEILDLNITIWLKGTCKNVNEQTSTRYIIQSYNRLNCNQTVNFHLENSHFSVLLANLNLQKDDGGMVSNKYSRKRKEEPGSHIINNMKHSESSSIKVTKERNVKTPDSIEDNTETNLLIDSAQVKDPAAARKRRKLDKSFSSTYINNEVIERLNQAEASVFLKCRKLGIKYLAPEENETQNSRKSRRRTNKENISKTEKKLNVDVESLPPPPPLTTDGQFNKAMDCIRGFELKQLSYTFKHCLVCHERRLEMKMASDYICYRCNSDKNKVKMFSEENQMNPFSLPKQLKNLTLVEQQLICRIAPLIHVHMLKHGGIAANGHCVTFPQNVNEPAKILPKLPKEIQIIRIRKKGSNDTSKEFKVRRSVVENSLIWLKQNNPAYTDIVISSERLSQLPENAPINVETIDVNKTSHTEDKGPAPQQVDPGQVDDETVSCVTLPENVVSIKEQVEKVVKDVVGADHGGVTEGRKYVCIPWPTQNDIPLSEFTTRYFFTLGFPCLFPYGLADFHINRPRTCSSMTDWAEHLMWFEDGRFARHQYFKFIVHNIIMRKRTLEQSNYIVKQQLGDEHLSMEELKEMLNSGDNSIAKKILYFGACLRGTSQYWAQRNRELRSLIQFQINEGKGLPSFFTTGSCAEYHFTALKRLLQLYITHTTGEEVDLNNRNDLFTALQRHTHIVSDYFDLRTQAYFNMVMIPVFGVETYWYRQEFAKSRGMIHCHGLCWRRDREPHNLLNEAIKKGLNFDECAQELSNWAKSQFGMTASHPAGKDETGHSRKDLWPPPEGTADAPAEEDNPLIKLLMNVSESQEKLLEDHILLTNRVNIHRCSDYCLRRKGNRRVCRMEFGTQENPGKPLRECPAIVKDKNGSLRLEMERDHPTLVQHSRYHTQGWRANGDVSLILSKSSPDNPSIYEIIATEKYITGYACKGNESTDAVAELYHDIVNNADENQDCAAKFTCTKLLMNTVKRDISSMEASYERLGLPLYRCSHSFQNVSFSGSRLLEKTGETLTKSTSLDKYLARPSDQKCSWYSYICKQGKVPVIAGGSVRATWPLNEEYCRSMILLHFPNWRKPEDIKSSDLTWMEIMQKFMTTDECPNFVKADIEKAKLQESNEQNSCDTSETEDDEVAERPDWMELFEPQKHFSELEIQFDDGGSDFDWGSTRGLYPNGFGIHWLEDLDKEQVCNTDNMSSEELMSLNRDQRFAFCLILNTLIQFNKGSSSFKPLRLIVTGTAGSGKSFLIKCVVSAIQKLCNNNKSVQVLCPTGNSANLISGKTIHDFLKIPTNFQARKEMSTPDGVKGEIIQDNCKELLALIVDERSLVGATTLGWMEFHCRYGKGQASMPWGGLPVVVFLGDDIQLPPVCDSPVYMSKGKNPASIHGTLVWKEFNNVVEMITIVRQKETEQQLKNVLTSLREYKTTSEETKWLQQFQWGNLLSSHGEELLTDMNNNGLFVFPTHAKEHDHNMQQLTKANTTVPVAKIVAVNTGPHSKKATCDKSGGLLNILYLCVGAKVMMTNNLIVHYGLFNGSMGTVRDIIFLNNRSPKDSLPDVVMVEFPRYTGPAFLVNDPKVVPIVPVQRKIDCFCFTCKRTQIPLRLGWGTTIHRCQGMTVGKNEANRYIVIDPGKVSFESQNPGALFVALSRAKTAGDNTNQPDFAWHPEILINEDRICHVVRTPTTSARDKEIKRLHQIASQTTVSFKSLYRKHAFENILNVLSQNPIEE